MLPGSPCSGLLPLAYLLLLPANELLVTWPCLTPDLGLPSGLFWTLTSWYQTGPDSQCLLQPLGQAAHIPVRITPQARTQLHVPPIGSRPVLS